MGSSYRDEIRQKAKRAHHASETVVRARTASRAALRELYFRKSSTGRRQCLKAEAQKRLM